MLAGRDWLGELLAFVQVIAIKASITIMANEPVFGRDQGQCPDEEIDHGFPLVV